LLRICIGSSYARAFACCIFVRTRYKLPVVDCHRQATWVVAHVLLAAYAHLPVRCEYACTLAVRRTFVCCTCASRALTVIVCAHVCPRAPTESPERQQGAGFKEAGTPRATPPRCCGSRLAAMPHVRLPGVPMGAHGAPRGRASTHCGRFYPARQPHVPPCAPRTAARAPACAHMCPQASKCAQVCPRVPTGAHREPWEATGGRIQRGRGTPGVPNPPRCCDGWLAAMPHVQLPTGPHGGLRVPTGTHKTKKQRHCGCFDPRVPTCPRVCPRGPTGAHVWPWGPTESLERQPEAGF
jgi:hypothetical protein